MPKNNQFPSELRKDLISEDWVIIAKGRSKKPETFKKKKRKQSEMKEEDCPFCEIKTQRTPLLIYNLKGEVPLKKGIPDDWSLVVIPNKYPALLPSPSLNRRREGEMYETLDAVGHCELIVTRDHKRNIADFNVKEVEQIVEAFQKRYLFLMGEPFVSYVSMFQNHGSEAGASQPHPHFQIITTPLIDADLTGSLENSKKYFEKKGECAYCKMIQWDLKQKKRIVYENDHFVALCPFASKSAFQVIITPKEHLSHFEKITPKQKSFFAEAVQKVAQALNKGLSDPAYNFYAHTAPSNHNGNYSFYHWHWTFLPRTTSLAGFELGSQMEISVIEPEKAAEYLRSCL